MDYSQEDIQYFQFIQEESYVNPTEEVEHPPVAISMGEYIIRDNRYPIPIGTYGNFSFIQAPPKSKKTFFATLLSAVYLKGKVDKHGGIMRGHRKGKKLVHFDTEQGKFHAQKSFNRALNMSECDLEDYKTFALRTTSHKYRLMFIDYYINKVAENVGLVIIDGIADLVSDVNNIDECNSVVQKLMEWSDKLQCHIITIIHSNYGSQKPTGHLGSALEKKTETQIELIANDDDNSVRVKCRRSRGFPFDEFHFVINDYGLPTILGQSYDTLDEPKFKT